MALAETINPGNETDRKKDRRAMAIYDEYLRAVQFDAEDRERERQNHHLFWGVNNGQHEDDLVASMTVEGRVPDTYNIAGHKVDSLTGAVLKNPFETEYVPVDNDISGETTDVKGIYLSDKEMMDWEGSREQLVQNGLVYGGFEKMEIDDRYHPLGNISFRSCLPGQVVKDPFWRSNTFRDARKCWFVPYLTAKQMQALFPKHKDIIGAALIRSENRGEDFGDPQDVTPEFYHPTNSGDRFQVIEQYEMIDEWVDREYDKMTGLTLPETDDLAYKIQWLNETNQYWTPEMLGVRQERRRTCWVTTICPDIGMWLVLQHAKCEIQIGRLPFFFWSASIKNGKCRGIIDIIKDAQRHINNRENLITYMIQTAALSSELVDPLLFSDPNKLSDYKKRRNTPGAIFETAAGALQRGLAPHRPQGLGGNTQEVTQQLQRLWDIIDRISKAPAVLDARAEPGESGYLFAQRTAIMAQQQYTLFSGLKRYEGEKGEAYLEQAKRQYSLGRVKRSFRTPDGRSILVNDTLPNGQIGLKSDISRIPRYRVVISDSPEGITNRLTSRSLSVEIMKTIPPEKIGTRAILAKTLVDSVDTLSKADKAKLAVINEIEVENAIAQLRAQTSGFRAKDLMAQKQIRALEAELAPKPAIPGPGGQPQPGQASVPIMTEEEQPQAEPEQIPAPTI